MDPISELITSLDEHHIWEDTIALKRNTFLCKQGLTNTNVYFVIAGALRLFVVDDLEEHTIRFGYTNNLIAILDSFLTNNPSNFYLQTLKSCSLKVVSKVKFMAFIEATQERRNAWVALLENFVLQQMEREHDILTASPIERYKRVLKRSPQLFQEIPHKYIASYLRMTPETLSRIKKS